MLRAESKSAEPPMMTPYHLEILGWLSGCARVHLCGSCLITSECEGFWDRVASSNEERVRDTRGYYQRHWARLQEKRERRESSAWCVSGEVVWNMT